MRRIFVALAAFAVAACQADPVLSPTPPAPPSPSALAPTATPLVTSPPLVPAGRIVFMRDRGEVEEYFTINSDGSNEVPIFTGSSCACARWSFDGTHIQALGATSRGTYSLMTIKPDGTERQVVDPVAFSPRAKTLNLAVGPSTADGRRLAFNGWDEVNPTMTGLYIAGPDLSGLTLSLSPEDGIIAFEPFGFSADGSQIAFFGERGAHGGVSHFGRIYVVDLDGAHLRQLSPAETGTGFFGPPAGAVSPDGTRVAFATGDDERMAVYVADLAGGPARRISEWGEAGSMWAVGWSPTGDWISYSEHHGLPQVVTLVRPDGTDQHAISKLEDGPDQAVAGVWSPDGRYLLVERGRHEQRDLWIMDLEGTFIGQVTDEPSSYRIYSWAPRGP
jgi:WD40-like Beta Propeller Repeat